MLPTNGFLQAFLKSERERRRLLSTLRFSSHLQQAVKEAFVSQRLLHDALAHSSPFTKVLEDIDRINRNFARAITPVRQLMRMTEEINRTQQMLRNDLGGAKAVAGLAQTISRQQQLLNQTNLSAQLQNLTATLAISRTLTLFPMVSAASSAVVNALETDLSDAAALPTPEESAAWITRLEDLLHATERAIETVEDKIDRRALLRFIERILPLLLAVYAIVHAHISSDQVDTRLGGIEAAIEEHRVETKKAHDKQKDTLKKAIRRLESRLGALTDRLSKQREEDESVAFYIVVRSVPMTAERRYHGTRITWLLPGQEVEIVERSKKWVRVIAHDIESGEIQVGWVLKKYLKRVTDLN